jgi:hypothetical protein
MDADNFGQKTQNKHNKKRYAENFSNGNGFSPLNKALYLFSITHKLFLPDLTIRGV